MRYTSHHSVRKKTTTLNKSIFEYSAGIYTNDALLYQDILLCLVINKTVLENNPFKLRELEKWLLENNNEIRNYFQGPNAHTTISNRINIKNDRVEGKFKGLQQMRLIRESIAKNLQPMDSLYEYTRGGILFARIVKSMNLKKVINITKSEDKISEYRKELEKIYQDMYHTIVDLVFKARETSSASVIFYSTLFKKCKDKGIFDKFVDRIHYIIDNTDNDIVSMADLFEHAVNFAFFDKQNTETDFLDALYETLEELDEEVRKLILYRLKISAEKKFENKQEDLTREYEEFRFNQRSNYELIAVQGYCEYCKSKQNLALHYKELTSRKVNCPNCNTKQIALEI